MMAMTEFDFPQRLKPSVDDARNGTAEAVPFQIAFTGTVLEYPMAVLRLGSLVVVSLLRCSEKMMLGLDVYG
jgi:hypothetical protein